MKSVLWLFIWSFTALLWAQDKQESAYFAEINHQLTAKRALIGQNPQAQLPAKINGRVQCVQGQAAGFPCQNVDLMSFLSIGQLGGSATTELSGNWGWTDPTSKREFLLQGSSIGTHFIEITHPENPIYLGILPIPSTAKEAIWRELKTYRHYAYIVGDAAGDHGMQIFDLNKLLNVQSSPQTFSSDGWYKGFGSAHDMVINEATGYAYPVGISSLFTGVSGRGCGGGYHMLDLKTDPLNPIFKGCFQHLNTGRRGTGYSHDAQCVVYHGPDTVYQGKEICFGFNETAVSIADVSDKANPQVISQGTYQSVAYCHQGWLTEDHKYLYVDDEFDETDLPTNTRTIIFDITDLDNPTAVNYFVSNNTAIDHNQYIRGQYAFQANYTSGLHILDISNPTNPKSAGYFDTYLANDNPTYDGLWNVYAFFPSGYLAVGGIGEGVFILKPTLPGHLVAEDRESFPEGFALSSAYPNPFRRETALDLTLAQADVVQITVYDLLGRVVRQLPNTTFEAGKHQIQLKLDGLSAGAYWVKVQVADKSFFEEILVSN